MSIKNWKKTIYIASKIGTSEDDYANEIILYDEPVRYQFNVQPLSSDVDLREFGEKASMVQKAVIPIKYKNCFKENDIAYLDGVTPENEISYGDNANYKLKPPRIQNMAIVIYFERLTGK